MSKITIKDIPKLKVVCSHHNNFTVKKALSLIPKVLDHLAQQDVNIVGLPLAVIDKNKEFCLCLPVRGEFSQTGDFSLDILPSHRMGIITHNEPQKPLMFSEEHLRRQLRYQGFVLLWPYRLIFRQNPQDANSPIIEIQVPIRK